MDCVLVRVGCLVCGIGEALPNELPYPSDGEPMILGSFGPGAEADATKRLNVSLLPLFPAWQTGRDGVRLYIYGEIAYRDMFDNAEAHFTAFCFYSARGGEVFRVASSHNTAR